MSFSSDVKCELAGHTDIPRHCAVAQLSAMAAFLAVKEPDGLYFRGDVSLLFVVRELIVKSFKADAALLPIEGEELYVADAKLSEALLMSIRWMRGQGQEPLRRFASGVLLKNECCKKAFIKGAFLCGGSVNDPHGAYHLEIVCRNEEDALELLKLMQGFIPDTKAIPRKGRFICYIKEADGITDMLNVMGAMLSQLEFVNAMIIKDVRNDLNRKVNCETANLNKTVSAAVKQIRDIELIRDTLGLGYLKDSLRDMAKLRLENPDLSLKDLGELLEPPIGRSGVNHRLKAISEIARDLRGGL